jgi:hypothetical protein
MRVSILVLAFILAPGATAAVHTIRGRVADATGAGAVGASVDLFDSDSKAIAHATADSSGKFQIQSAADGNLILKVWLRGFLSSRLRVVAGPEAKTIEMGDVRLEVAGCDAPGHNCDSFGTSPPDPVVSQGNLHAKVSCLVALVAGKVYCPGEGHEADADLRLTKEDRGLFLVAANGAALSAPNPPHGDCHDAHPDQKKTRLDGLGPGDDICLYTHDRHWSHIFLTENASRGSERIAFWQITRRR